MSFWVQGSKSQYLGAFVYILRQYFRLISKKLAYQGGTPRLIKSFPCAENFLFSLTDDIFVICNLKVTKNNRNTYHNMHFDKKLPKKYSVHISGYIPCSRHPVSWKSTTRKNNKSIVEQYSSPKYPVKQ